MPRPRPIGAADPLQAFAELRPLWAELRRLQGQCEPFKGDYLALGVALASLEQTAEHFTRRRHFFSAGG